MNVYDPFWLDLIRDTFAVQLTNGYLRVYPLVTSLLTMTLTIMLFVGIVAAWFSSFHPIALVKIGDVILRVMVIWAIALNWNWLFDGFLQSVVTWGGLIGGSTLTSDELLSPGSVLLLGVRLSGNFWMIVVALADDWWYSPILFGIYGLAYVGLWVTYTVVALALLAGQVEFQFISVFAFLMWPLMPIWFLSSIATSMVQLLIGSALRLGGVTALYSIILPFLVELGLPDAEDPTIQSAMSFMVGLAIMTFFIWRGPQLFGRAMWPGSGLASLGLLIGAAFRRR